MRLGRRFFPSSFFALIGVPNCRSGICPFAANIRFLLDHGAKFENVEQAEQVAKRLSRSNGVVLERLICSQNESSSDEDEDDSEEDED